LISSGSSATSFRTSSSPVYLSLKQTSGGASLLKGIVLLTAPVAFLASKELLMSSSLAILARSAFDNFGPSASLLLTSSGSSATSAS